MADNKFLKFYKGTSAADAEVGAIWFDTANRLIKVKIAESGDNMWQAYSGLQNAEWLSEAKQLQLTKADGSKFTVDFSDVASAKGVGAFTDAASNTSDSSVHARINQAFAEISTKLEAADQVVKSVDTTADAGVALVKDADGKLSVSVTEGTVAENNEAVVLGGQVYAAVEAAKTELAGQISGKNVDAQGDDYVNATAANNKVIVTATTKLSDAVALAETAVQEVVTGDTNGTIKVDGTEVAVAGLQDAAYVTVESLNTTAKGYADAAEALLNEKIGVPAGVVDGEENAISAYSKDYTVGQDIKVAKDAAAAAQATIDNFLTGEGIDPQKVETLKEIVAYIEEHGGQYEDIVENLNTLNDAVDVEKVSTAIATAKGEAVTAANGYTDEAIADEVERAEAAYEKIGVAKGLVDTLADRVSANETAVQTTLPAAIATAKSEAIADADGKLATAKTELQGYADQAEADAIASAQTYADGKVKELADGAVAANTAAIDALDKKMTTNFAWVAFD